MDSASYELCADAIDVVLDVSSIYAPSKPAAKTADGDGAATPDADAPPPPPPAAASATDAKPRASAASITLSNGMALARRPSGYYLGLACARPSRGVQRHVEDVSSSSSSVGARAQVLDEVDSNLALVCLLRSENLEKRDLIDYNLGRFRSALERLSALNAGARNAGGGGAK